MLLRSQPWRNTIIADRNAVVENVGQSPHSQPQETTPSEKQYPLQKEQSVLNKSETGHWQEDGNMRRVFLCNFPTFFEEQNIRNFCEEYGSTVIVEIQLQKSNANSSLGMGFVTFSKPEFAAAAQMALDGCVIFNQKVSARLVD